ncbi:MAG TPA: ABC transporter substrate-binding protein [Gammaproteobacteria bacterium]|nr:ABC transporter substrate-binding protein [Gammaproteobacteria bacterium]
MLAASAGALAALPSVASINLCADQLVLTVAAPEQVLTVSWLSADPEESLLATQAARYPLNYGSAEELLRFHPDVVIAGAYTNAFTRALLARLGYKVIELEPEDSAADIARNLQVVAAAIGREERGDALVAELDARARQIAAARPEHSPATVVVRPGGFTVGEHSLADELMKLAGVRNVAAEQGLDRWGSLSMETLLASRPDLIVLTGYRASQPSLANAVLRHPALRLVRNARTATVPAPYWDCGLPQSLDAAALLQQAATQ